MPRARVTPLFPIAVAPARAAECIGIDRSKIDVAIKLGQLRVYRHPHGVARRILVADLVEWIKTHWKIVGGRHVLNP